MSDDLDQREFAHEASRPTSTLPGGEVENIVNPQIQLDEKLVEELADWIQNELYAAEGRRSDMEIRLNGLARAYEAKPESPVKNFPWKGACNLVVPVAATAVETVFTRITGAIFGTHDLYAGRARSANWTDAVEPVTDFLNWVNQNVFDANRIYSRWILSCVKYGNATLKLPWVRRIREVRYMDVDGSMVAEQVLMHDGPSPEFIPLEDFFWSADANATQDLQNCDWIAQRFYVTWKQLKEAELSGDYQDVERIKDFKRGQWKESETDMQLATGDQPREPNDYELFEVWASYPIDEQGTLAEIVVTIHKESKTILRAVYNFYRHQERPFHVIKFFPRENSFLGIGLVEMLLDVQEEVTAIHRNRLDNATLANAKMYKRTQGANVSIDDAYPGAIVDVESQDDLTVMDMGTPHTTLLVEEQHTITIGEKRSGVSDYSVGRESSAIGSRATATSTMALIREGNRRFQFLIREVRKSLTDIGHQIVGLYQQFAPEREVSYELFDEKSKEWFRRVMTLPPEYSRANIAIDVRTLDDDNNKEIQQQAYMTMMKVLQETYLNVGNALMVIANPEAPPSVKGLAEQGAVAASKLIQRLLEAFDFKDAEVFSPNIDELLAMTAALEMGGQVGQFIGAGGPPGAGGLQAQQAMDAGGQGAGIPRGGGPGPTSPAGTPLGAGEFSEREIG